jgi:hypothetical protein
MKTLIGLLAALAAGCGASNAAKQITLMGGDGGDDACEVSCPAACRGDLSTSTCPATWEQAQTASCAGASLGLGLGHAGQYLAFGNTSGGFGAFACYYSAATHDLVGAWSESDVNEYCDHTSFDIFYGAVDQGLPIRWDINAVQCKNDGGTSDGPAVP